jgi:hypothetical protein
VTRDWQADAGRRGLQCSSLSGTLLTHAALSLG